MIVYLGWGNRVWFTAERAFKCDTPCHDGTAIFVLGADVVQAADCMVASQKVQTSPSRPGTPGHRAPLGTPEAIERATGDASEQAIAGAGVHADLSMGKAAGDHVRLLRQPCGAETKRRGGRSLAAVSPLTH